MLRSSKVLTFLLGFLIGVILYFLAVKVISRNNWLPVEERKKLIKNVYEDEFRNWLERIKNTDGKRFEQSFSDDLYGKLESEFIFEKVKVTCVVFFENQKNAYLIHNTWGRKCNSLEFYSKSKDNFLKTNVIHFSNKWQYFCDTLRHLWTHKQDLEWVLFSLDDVYVIPENLRYFVATKDYNKPYYFGHKAVFWQQLYHSDKTSFVLSKGAIKHLMTKFNSSSACAKEPYVNNAVYNLGKELSLLGIPAADGRDHLGRERFHIFTFEQLMSEENYDVIAKHSKTSFFPTKQGKDCCSDTSISFRSVQNDRIYLFYYLLYKVKTSTSFDTTKRKEIQDESDEVWKDFVRKELGENVDLSTITNEKYYELWRSKMWEPEEFNRKIRENIMMKIPKLI